MSDKKTSLALTVSAKFSFEKKKTTTSIRTVRGKPENSTVECICFVHRKYIFGSLVMVSLDDKILVCAFFFLFPTIDENTDCFHNILLLQIVAVHRFNNYYSV